MVDISDDKKLKAAETALDAIKAGMKAEVAGIGLIDLNIAKNPKLIEFLQKAYDLPVNGKVDQALLDKLDIKKIDDLTTKKVAEVIEKLQTEGKIGPNSYKKPEEGGDPSYLIALSDALKRTEVRKLGAAGSALGALGSFIGGNVGSVLSGGNAALKETSDAYNAAKTGLDKILPPRPPAVAAQPASAPAAPASASAPVDPASAPASAPAPAAAPAGSAAITSNAFNEAITSSLKPLLNGTGTLGLKVDHETLRIVPGQESRVVKFLEMALDLKDGQGNPIRTGKVSDELKAALGIDDIKKLDGKKLMEVIEKVQADGKFAKGGDPEMVKALFGAVRDMKPASKLDFPLRLAIESAEKDLKEAMGKAVPKVSLGPQDSIIVAAADTVTTMKGGYFAGDMTLAFGAVGALDAFNPDAYQPIVLDGLVGHEIITPVKPPVIAEVTEALRSDAGAVPKASTTLKV